MIVTTTVRLREEVWRALRTLAEIKRAQQGNFGRPSVSATVADLALAELERVEAKAKARKRA